MGSDETRPATCRSETTTLGFSALSVELVIRVMKSDFSVQVCRSLRDPAPDANFPPHDAVPDREVHGDGQNN